MFLPFPLVTLLTSSFPKCSRCNFPKKNQVLIRFNYAVSKKQFELNDDDLDREERPPKFKAFLQRHIPIIQWLPKYTKIDVISDLIAGITIGLTMMPQSIAYASLADIPPQNGLYTALMASLLYISFGTIKEASIGPTSLLALLTYSYTEGLPVGYVVLLTFATGCVELLLGVLRLGFLVDFISVPVTSGFTSATSIIIISAQLKNLMGLKFRSKGIIDLYYNLFASIGDAKWGDVILGVSCMAILLIFRQLGRMKVSNPKLKKTFWLLSISRNALIVLFSTIVALILHRTYGKPPFRIVGNVPDGLPSIQLPPFQITNGNETANFIDMLKTLGSGVIVVPLVAIFQNIAIAKSFAAGTIVDATQEMLTLGMINVVGSLVQAMPASGAFTRSAVSSASGVRTPLSGMYAAVLIFFALTVLTPYFYFIPKATLSAILITAVIFMIDIQIVPKLWRCNRFDFAINMLTFIFCLFYGVEMGLLIGVLINLTALVKPWTRPRIERKIYTNYENETVLILKPELGLYFPGVDFFSEEIIKQSLNNKMPVGIDFGHVLKIDYTAQQTLQNIVEVFKKKDRQLIFLNINEEVYEKIKSLTEENHLKVYGNLDDIEKNNITRTRDDAEVEKPLLVKHGRS